MKLRDIRIIMAFDLRDQTKTDTVSIKGMSGLWKFAQEAKQSASSGALQSMYEKNLNWDCEAMRSIAQQYPNFDFFSLLDCRGSTTLPAPKASLEQDWRTADQF